MNEPCPESWDEMAGDEVKRYCEKCELHVHNLSGMTREEAGETVASAEERLCVRFLRDHEGKMINVDTLPARRGFLRGAAAAFMALAGSLLGCRGSGEDQIVGDVCPPEELQGGEAQPEEIQGEAPPPEEIVGRRVPEVELGKIDPTYRRDEKK